MVGDRGWGVLGMWAAAMVTVCLGIVVQGCGSGEVEIDRSALYSPESLASEFASRYQALKPEARKSERTRRPKTDQGKAARLERQRAKDTKKIGDAVAKKKQAGVGTTMDDLVDDIEFKLGLIREMSRGDACRKMVDTIGRDQSLTAEDKKALGEQVEMMAEGG